MQTSIFRIVVYPAFFCLKCGVICYSTYPYKLRPQYQIKSKINSVVFNTSLILSAVWNSSRSKLPKPNSDNWLKVSSSNKMLSISFVARDKAIPSLVLSQKLYFNILLQDFKKSNYNYLYHHQLYLVKFFEANVGTWRRKIKNVKKWKNTTMNCQNIYMNF